MLLAGKLTAGTLEAVRDCIGEMMKQMPLKQCANCKASNPTIRRRGAVRSSPCQMVACTPLLTQAGIARPPPAPWRHTQTGQHLNKRRFACREGASKVFQMPLTPAQIARNAVLGTILRPITINPSDAASGGVACFILTNTGTNAMWQLCNYPAYSISQLVRAEMLPVVMLAPVMLMQRLPGWSRSLRRSWPQAGRPAMQRPSRHL